MVLVEADPSNLLKVQVSILTPFAEIDGVLEFPEDHWMKCTLSTKIFQQLQRLSAYDGVCNGLRLKLHNHQSFLGLVGKGMNDIWLRFRTMEARVQIDLNNIAEGVNHIDTLKSLVSNDDEVILGDLVSREQASMLHLTVTLMSDEERMVDDSTVRFYNDGPEDICCICLDQMRSGEVLRRLPCLHEMHAGCAMCVLPHMASCPLCRAPLVCTLGSPDPLSSAGSQGLPQPRRESWNTPTSRGILRMRSRADAYRVSSAPSSWQSADGPGLLREASNPSTSSRQERAAALLPPHPDTPLRSSARGHQFLAYVKSTLSKIPKRLLRIPWGRRSASVHAFTSRPETA